MNKTDKPFACTTEGCQMTFTNEDHLNIHQKKHDMVLNLGLTCKTNAFADQTPTPTRFIRNCEEVGLFQDLQNVNPFEETFRKAIEHSKNGVAHIPEATNDDTLHTPHIFPHIAEENVDKFRRTTSDEPPSKEFGINDVPAITINSGEAKSNNEVIDLTEDEADNVRPSTSKTLETSNSNSNSLDILNYVGLTSVASINNRNNTKAQVKEKIKVALQNKKQDAAKKSSLENNATLQSKPEKKYNIPLILPKRPRKRSGTKGKLQNPESLTIQAKTSVSFYDKNLSETEKRRAMNRVAQMRSRERKKIWLDHIETEISKLKTKNKELVVENQRLTEENVLLKTILLAHNNCPVTKSGEVPTLISIHETTRVRGQKLVPIVPKPNPKCNSSRASVTVYNPPSLTPVQQMKPTSKIILSPVENTKRKRLLDEGMRLPKLIARPDITFPVDKIKTENEDVILLE